MLQYSSPIPLPSIPSNHRHVYPVDSRPRISTANSATVPISKQTSDSPVLPPTIDPDSPSVPPRSPYISSRILSATQSQRSSYYQIQDVFFPGDIIGQNSLVQGESIYRLPASSDTPPGSPAAEFQVIRRLGAGSYAVVYLVREILSRSHSPDNDDSALIGVVDDHDPCITFGREYAIKCLSKADLDEDALAAQMSEVTIHQSLNPHPNIVTLHRTLETSSFLLLLLEYVPGQDLFYFLEQARDHYDQDPAVVDSSHINMSNSTTPPTPGLLSASNPAQLLTASRLRLISSMFSQMCDAVAACHAQQVYHRDIKPENFIVTDGWITRPDGGRERKVVVKLSDFGLSTTESNSSDMDCGSAPYMSYECRNNVAPTYKPRAADVWSLGIVLINMLYHHNPWTDTTQGVCSSFERFRRQPVPFFMQRFPGMTRPVAELLANRVFCILPNEHDDSSRISAAELGIWAKDMPSLLQRSHAEVVPVAQGHRISPATQFSHRPSSRNASGASRSRSSPAVRANSLPRAPISLEPIPQSELSLVMETTTDETEERDGLEGANSRSSTNRRRRRGARKGKGGSSTPREESLDTLAAASQNLAREISRVSCTSSTKRSVVSTTSSQRSRNGPYEPVSMYSVPTALFAASPVPSPLPSSLSSASRSTNSIPSSPQAIAKKSSKWKLSFGKSSGGSLSGNSSSGGRSLPTFTESSSVSVPDAADVSNEGSAMATNVSNLIMGLNAPSRSISSNHPQTGPVNHDAATPSTWSRGRRFKPTSPYETARQNATPLPLNSNRAISPSSTRSGAQLTSSASSMASGNWRSSMSTSSAGTSTSAFTRYSNSSTRSISTAATSVSASSWRTGPTTPTSAISISPVPDNLPKNIKYMTGVPWELDQLPRDMNFNPHGEDLFGNPPPRNKRTRKPKLEPITERPSPAFKSSPYRQRKDASTSTTDLSDDVREVVGDDVEGPRKVQRGQITALAKMLSALRR